MELKSESSIATVMVRTTAVESEVVIREAKQAGYRLADKYDFVKGDKMDYFLVFTAGE